MCTLKWLIMTEEWNTVMRVKVAHNIKTWQKVRQLLLFKYLVRHWFYLIMIIYYNVQHKIVNLDTIRFKLIYIEWLVIWIYWIFTTKKKSRTVFWVRNEHMLYVFIIIINGVINKGWHEWVHLILPIVTQDEIYHGQLAKSVCNHST